MPKDTRKNLVLNNFLQKWGTMFAILLLILMFSFEIVSASYESQAIDEGPHLTAGYSYWLNQRIELNPEHPPLLKEISGLFIAPLRPVFIWNNLTEQNQWDIAEKFFYEAGNNADLLLFFGRLPTMLLSLVLGFIIFIWTRKIAGVKAGLIATMLYVFDPNILAHSRYITTDIPVTLGFVATLYLFSEYIKKSSLRNLFLLLSVFALAQLTKFSAILLLPFIMFINLFANLKKRKYLLVIFGAVAFTAIFMLIIYFGHPGAYFEGIQSLFNHEKGGHSTYLMGNYDLHTFKMYFPIAFLVKTPLITILLLLLTLPIFLRKLFENKIISKNIKFIEKIKSFISKLSFVEWIIICFPFYYFAASMINRLNIGIRHILPIYPYIFIFIAIYLFQETNINKYHAIVKKIGLILIVLLMIESIIAFPNYLSYFSPLIGGSNHGHKYILDSNIDWGQDLKKLSKYLKDNNIKDKINLGYYGKASPQYYNINYQPLTSETKKGWLAVSIQEIMSEDLSKRWLLDEIPIAKIGGSIYLYHIQ